MNENTRLIVWKTFKVHFPRVMCFALSIVFVALSVSCVPTTAHVKDELPGSPAKTEVTLRPGDEIELKFPYWTELNDTQKVRPDGLITLQLVDAVQAQGLTPEELDEKLTELYKSKIKDPVITVVVRSLVDQRIYVGGEVNSPGLLTLQGEVDALQAVINAGGFKESAKVDHVIVIRKGKDGTPIPYKVNANNNIYGIENKQSFVLLPNDVVFVPRSNIANLNLFVKQYIADLFLFKGIGLGFSYELHSDNSKTETTIR